MRLCRLARDATSDQLSSHPVHTAWAVETVRSVHQDDDRHGRLSALTDQDLQRSRQQAVRGGSAPQHPASNLSSLLFVFSLLCAASHVSWRHPSAALRGDPKVLSPHPRAASLLVSQVPQPCGSARPSRGPASLFPLLYRSLADLPDVSAQLPIFLIVLQHPRQHSSISAASPRRWTPASAPPWESTVPSPPAPSALTTLPTPLRPRRRRRRPRRRSRTPSLLSDSAHPLPPRIDPRSSLRPPRM